MQNIKVSVITTSFNSVKTIEDTIKSVLNQTYPNIEYIIVDGGSSDGTQDIVKKYSSKIAQFISQKDKGLFDGLNKGIKLATGDIVGMMHTDDFYGSNNVIETVVNEMEKTNSDVTWGDLVYVDRLNPEKTIRFWKSSSYSSPKLFWGWHPPHTTFYARKEIFERFGYYNLSLRMAADYELMLRFLKVYKVKSVYIPKTLTRMRVGGVSDRSLKNIKAILRGNVDSYRAWRVNKLYGGLLVPFLKPISKVFQSLT
ncbi:MAG: glycosyltransferase family 2 protein [bacterium]|nr:glycosyltransferase family 2 protein [bacterium]